MKTIKVGMIGAGMIFEETYLPFFLKQCSRPLYSVGTGPVQVQLYGIASRTGARAQKYLQLFQDSNSTVRNLAGQTALTELLQHVDVVCVATPDDRHFEIAQQALLAGKHVLIEKPSVLSLTELDRLIQLAADQQKLCKVVYHKLLDPDHKRLRTLVLNGTLQHVNNGFCSLLEPRQISANQFSEWIKGRNPATYVAIHYVKLIDFTFNCDWKLKRVAATGQRGIVASPDSQTWDSVQLQITYQYPDRREATFDIHTSWVMPDNFPGYVEQEVQFRFDNAHWNAHQRKRGVELAVVGKTPELLKETPNHHYNALLTEPWNETTQRGYGIEVIERFFQELAFVEFAEEKDRKARYDEIAQLEYNDIRSDRNSVAVVQCLEVILATYASEGEWTVCEFNNSSGSVIQRYFDGRKSVISSTVSDSLV
ncbi:MAG: Gfo/Idh/MocA family oxidoreductase [Zavarzinella sp.]